MDLPTATAFVSLRLSPSTEPAIEGGEILALLTDHAQTTDADDIEPGETGWTPTYSRIGCYAAIAEGWSIKAGRVAHRFDFTAPTQGGQFRLSQILDHCEAMAKKYAVRAGRSVNNSNAVTS